MNSKPFAILVFRLVLAIPILLLLIWVLSEFGAPRIATYMAPRFVTLSALEEEAFRSEDAAQRKKWFDDYVSDCVNEPGPLLDQSKEQRVQTCTKVRDQHWRSGYVVPRLMHPAEVHHKQEIEPRVVFIRQKLVPSLLALVAAAIAFLLLRHLCKLVTGVDLIPWLPIDPPRK